MTRLGGRPPKPPLRGQKQRFGLNSREASDKHGLAGAPSMARGRAFTHTLHSSSSVDSGKANQHTVRHGCSIRQNGDRSNATVCGGTRFAPPGLHQVGGDTSSPCLRVDARSMMPVVALEASWHGHPEGNRQEDAGAEKAGGADPGSVGRAFRPQHRDAADWGDRARRTKLQLLGFVVAGSTIGEYENRCSSSISERG